MFDTSDYWVNLRYSLIVRKGRDKYSLIFTVISQGSMKATDLLVIQRLLEDYEVILEDIKDITLLTTPLYALPAGETILSLDEPAEILTWKLMYKGSQRSLDIVSLKFNIIADFIANVKMELPR
ncbi:hypothetical protein DFR86_11505 [Acidianus sulfidivorans JP7]|nr:hypothetical protein [Acidianus sulfidivorans]AWR98097.2 hypothetical protein DFR86_11505 [Acidianus sulfidivorans JP7]